MSTTGGSGGHNGQPKRRGRPPAAPSQRRDQNITFRTSADIKEKLEQSAALSGRTVSQEIEFWLKISLNQDKILDGGEGSFIEEIISEACKTKISNTEKIIKKITDNATDYINRKRDSMENSFPKGIADEIESNKLRLIELEKRLANLTEKFEIIPFK